MTWLQNITKESKIWIVNYACAIDYYVDLNKQKNSVLIPGGKGINVAIVMKSLGFDPTVITFLGQPTKNLFLELVKPYDLNIVSFISETKTRINLKLLKDEKTTEINDLSPLITDANLTELLTFLKANVKNNDLVIINGRFKFEALEKVLNLVFTLTENVVIDVDESKMLTLLNQSKPLVMKPNIDEFQTMINTFFHDQQSLIAAIKKFHYCKLLLLSDGDKGAYLFDQNKLLFVSSITPKQVVSTTGAGDTLLAVFLANLILKVDLKTALIKATNYASATISKLGVVDSKDKISVITPKSYYL
ncbi:1-phosphofructokinase family hexose kinase [Mycoplasmoides genitalium]|uniref:Putative 1-phosphofructokinase n=2 Tax=Mycoplasmoides genitalium TaxID=2097 RepID=K1PF_MYCGE|nr:1-phosphofructokinase family hexose kinase [Mycoplasmoides genitalium]Q49396.3 RecName: Full=Putative 1-phosphofructokinase; AltName: Full=Fructose 1-phosphate kinase; Short=Fru1PK [Mycoplasmoides genitalium G37]ABY79440.1 1-phosphofructokinase, putative [synthetic Mycoplasma genitalium JCVI-1.0]AAC71280.2 1-phosphofructokinase, putative [Mycoplasmoides genitalium G37]AFQ02872.1 1-phosphofructokinase [Mycoplasmoides genitalium M2321]AFQ03857.1 1-phosphofructokinase [Mycoplasmoides genitaliu